MLASHYAPRARVRLNAADVRPGEAALPVRRRPTRVDLDNAVVAFDLSESGDLRRGRRAVVVPDCGRSTPSHVRNDRRIAHPGRAVALGESLNDRLRRAAADR